MRLTSLRRFLPLLVLLALAGCRSHDEATAPAPSPEADVRRSIALIRAGDFAGFWRHALPAQDYATLRADWARARAAEAPLTAAERERIDDMLRQLNAPDAKATLDAQLQPWLAKAQTRYADQLPLLIGIGRALAAREITDNPRLGSAQKQHATALLGALVPWAQQAPWFDPTRARQAVGVVVDTARKLDLHDAQSLRSMDFDQAMHSYATVFSGLKRLLALYGLPVDQALASARVVPLDYHPPYARVRIQYTLLGKPMSMESTLVQQDGHWYDQDLVQSVRQAHRRLAAPASAASTASTAVAVAAGH